MAVAFGLATGASYGQISLTTFDTAYTAFTGSSFVGTSDSLPAGWTVKVNDFNPGGLYAGTSGSGSVYYWVDGGNNHIGIQRSGSSTWGFDVSFANNTGSTISALDLSLDYSQIKFENDTSFLVTGTGALSSADLSGINFVGSPTGTNGTVVGISDSLPLTGLNIADGATFGISWAVTNPSGTDSAIGMGNFSLTAVPEPHEYALGIAGLIALVAFARRRRQLA